MEWVKQKKIKNIKNESWPPRSLFGEAIKDKFYETILIFQKYTDVEVEFIYDEVISIKKRENFYILNTKKKRVEVSNILICSGNYNSSLNSTLGKKLQKLSLGSNCKFYYNFLELLPNNNFWKEIKNKNIAVYGTGVSSIDIISKLIKKNNKIYSISKSSLFPFARPFNQKIDDPINKEHKPIFLTNLNINYLKKQMNNIKNIEKINFEKFIHPFIKIEFYFVYFRFFINEKDLNYFKTFLYKKIIKLKILKTFDFTEIVFLFDEFILKMIRSKKIKKKFFKYEWFGKENILKDIGQRKYNFYQIFTNPLMYTDFKNFPKEYLMFLSWDLKQSKLGNLGSPFKNACDGVWRDIRPQYTKLFDNCNNLPVFDYFIKNILPVHNKLCDGPSAQSIRDIKNLIIKKKINLIKANDAKYEKKNKNLFVNYYKKKVNLNYIFYGIVDLYKSSYKKDKMVSSMIKNHLVEINELKYKNKKYIIGLNLNTNQNPIVKNKVIKSIRFIGPAAEGRTFFHHTLSRPDKKQFNISDIIDWVKKLF